MKKYIPLLPRPCNSERQKEAHELWVLSHNENLAFRQYFESSETGLNACGFDGLYVDRDGAYADKIIEKFGYKRTMYMLANTVLLKKYDGRISHQLKIWADSILNSEEPLECVRQYILDSANPGVLDLFTKRIITMYNKYNTMAQNKDNQLDSAGYASQDDLQI